jgi:outer membrane protein insertion porin family
VTASSLGRSLLAQPASNDRVTEKGPRIDAVVLNGVRSIDVDQLRDGLATKPSECKTLLYAPFCLFSRSPSFMRRRYLDPVELRRDVLRIRLFYWRRGYRDVTVASRTDRKGDGVRVVFDIDEKKPTLVETLAVQQEDSILPRRAIDRALQLRAGEPLDLVALDSSVMLLRDELWERGYSDARIELDTSLVADSIDGGPVTIVLHPGPLTRVAAIEIDGNRQVSDRTIRRLLDFREGDLFRRSTVLESQRDLYLSGLFSQVEFAAPPAGDSSKVVKLQVAEAKLRQLDLSAGFTSADFVQLEAQFDRFNLLGSGRRLTLRGTVSNLLAAQLNGAGLFADVTSGAEGSARDPYLHPTWAASIDFTQPWFLSSRNQLGASVFAHRRSVPGIVIDRGRGATLAFTRDFRPKTNATLGYTYEATSIEASDVYFCVSFGVCVPSTISAIAGLNPLSPLSLVAQTDQSNDALVPNTGYRARLDLEHASAATFSEFRYNRAAASASAYFRTSKRTVLATRLRLGTVNPLQSTNEVLRVEGSDGETVVHPRKRFYAGGSQSVRGYGENQLGPRVLTISPTVLTDSTLTEGRCTNRELEDLSCDPNIPGVKSDKFQAQPLGGTSLVEGSVEWRFPLAIAKGLSGAIFVDGAIVGTDRFSDLLGVTGAVTPGFGVRFDTPVGPVRLDLGIRPKLVEDLPVITEVATTGGGFRLVTLNTARRYDPVDISGNFLQKILGRLTLHLAIGPAF